MKFLSVFRRSMIVGLGLALVVLVLIDINAFRSSVEYTKSVEVVKRTYRNLNTLRGVTGDLVSAESEVRGYTITADERYLSLYQSAEKEVEEGLAELRRSTADPVTLEHLVTFENLSRARLGRLDITQQAMREGGIEAVRLVAGPGKELMDEFRRTSSLIESRQLQLLAERELTASALSRRNTTVVIIGSTFAVALLIFSMVLLGRQLERQERLEGEVLGISEREQRRIGQDLHDGVCQQLTGISLLSRGLSHRLTDPLAAESAQITQLINECIEQTRRVTRGLHPVPDEPSGLMQALRELAEQVDTLGKLGCRFICPELVAIPDPTVATHLYRIAQEATQNALRHADPRNVAIQLTNDGQSIRLTVTDDGRGLPGTPTSDGIGLEIMAYRARSIGATLEVRPGPSRGTVVACVLPLASLP